MLLGDPIQSVDAGTGEQRSEFVAQLDDGYWVGIVALWNDDPERCAVNGEAFLTAVVATKKYAPNVG